MAEKYNEIARQSIDSISTTIISGMGPVGTAIAEVIQFRTKLKEKRLQNFLELLKEYIDNYSDDYNTEYLSSEQFSDLFESVILNVVKTSSKDKLLLYRNILSKNIFNINSIDEDFNIYIDLVSSLTESELKVLHEYYQNSSTYRKEAKKIEPLTKDLDELKKKQNLNSGITILDISHQNHRIDSDVNRKDKELKDQQKKVSDILNSVKPEKLQIEPDKFTFINQTLYSKGLLIDVGTGSVGNVPFIKMDITNFGLKFIEFIKEEK